MEQDDLRKQAIESLHRKRSFKNFVAGWFILNAIMVAVWALTGGGPFWPGWVLFGTTIALAFSAWGAYGNANRPITENDIQNEIKKLEK
jgi:hypothetical protein